MLQYTIQHEKKDKEFIGIVHLPNILKFRPGCVGRGHVLTGDAMLRLRLGDLMDECRFHRRDVTLHHQTAPDHSQRNLAET